MSFLFDTIDEYDDEIAFVRTQIRKSITGEEWSLNTSQSTQRVKMASVEDLRKYLRNLTSEKKALSQRNNYQGVTSIVSRRTF